MKKSSTDKLKKKGQKSRSGSKKKNTNPMK